MHVVFGGREVNFCWHGIAMKLSLFWNMFALIKVYVVRSDYE